MNSENLAKLNKLHKQHNETKDNEIKLAIEEQMKKISGECIYKPIPSMIESKQCGFLDIHLDDEIIVLGAIVCGTVAVGILISLVYIFIMGCFGK